MVTKHEAMTARMFYHVTLKNSDGTAFRARANGACKTWKTRPNEFRVPIKHGLYDYGEITHRNAHEWTTEEPAHATKKAVTHVS